MRRGLTRVALCGLMFTASCGPTETSAPASGKSPASASTTAPSAPKSAVSSAPSAPAPTPPTSASVALPTAPPQAAIRNNATSAPGKDGASTHARLFVSTLTKNDPIQIGLMLTHDKKIEEGHPWWRASTDWNEVLGNLRFTIKDPSGKTTELQLAERPKEPWSDSLASFIHAVAFDGSGVHVRDATALPWKTPVSALFGSTGRYEITVTGEAKAGKITVPIASKPLSFEVVEASPTRLSQAELEKAASAIITAKLGLKAKLAYGNSAVVEDEQQNLWFRFTTAGDSGHYQMTVLEVLLDPAGKEIALDGYSHFTCVAEGTLIATPQGPIAIEHVHEGDVVIAYDEKKRERTTAVVQSVFESFSESLVAFGDLRVTRSHPLFANGTWQLAGKIEPGAELLRLDLMPTLAQPVAVSTPARVFELAVSPPNTYFAGGLLVHNKARHVPIGEGQPWEGWFYRRAAAKTP